MPIISIAWRLDLALQDWIDTGTELDDRSDTKADVLWDETNQKLYVVSHIWTGDGTATPAGQRGELFRYSYNSATDTYTLDAGFPVEVTGGKSETLVLAKDSTGQLWVTYVENQQVMLNHSLSGNDRTWGTPFVLPATDAANLTTDDVSSIVAYTQHIGVMWSNQNTTKMYFAVHPGNAPDDVWSRVIPYSLSADDHINLKSLETDSAGNVFAVIKTSNSSARIVLLVCKNNINRCNSENDWTDYPVYDGTYGPTRPILLIDADNRDLYVFTRNKDPNDNNVGGIYYKTTDLDNIAFSDGIGVPFIKSLGTTINDPTSTKQNVNTATGLVVLASSKTSKYYYHNYLDLSEATNPIITSFTPTSGTEGTAVVITGANFISATAVAFNGTSAAFTVASDSEIQTTVPAGATTGPISVTNADGTGTSVDYFTVSTVPAITSFTPASGPVGTEVTLTGTGFTGATDVAFNGTPAGTFTVDSDTQIRADVPAGATTGPISVTNADGTGMSTDDFTVTVLQHTLTVISVGSGTVTIDPPGGVYDAGRVVTLTATATAGWELSGWSGDLSGSTNPETITMDTDRSVTATFKNISAEMERIFLPLVLKASLR
jgi:hypothetical protein